MSLTYSTFGKEKSVMLNVKYKASAVSPRIDRRTIDRKEIHKYVKKLCRRICRADRLGQLRKVRKLQRLMVRSEANLLLSIRRVTQVNAPQELTDIRR